MISLAGKAALITGGSRGIGAATVKLFARAGADVVFNYHRSRESAETVEQEARKHGTRVESLKADLAKSADAKKLADFIEWTGVQEIFAVTDTYEHSDRLRSYGLLASIVSSLPKSNSLAAAMLPA